MDTKVIEEFCYTFLSLISFLMIFYTNNYIAKFLLCVAASFLYYESCLVDNTMTKQEKEESYIVHDKGD